MSGGVISMTGICRINRLLAAFSGTALADRSLHTLGPMLICDFARSYDRRRHSKAWCHFADRWLVVLSPVQYLEAHSDHRQTASADSHIGHISAAVFLAAVALLNAQKPRINSHWRWLCWWVRHVKSAQLAFGCTIGGCGASLPGGAWLPIEWLTYFLSSEQSVCHCQCLFVSQADLDLTSDMIRVWALHCAAIKTHKNVFCYIFYKS